jgi:hypothetical protein
MLPTPVPAPASGYTPTRNLGFEERLPTVPLPALYRPSPPLASLAAAPLAVLVALAEGCARLHARDRPAPDQASQRCDTPLCAALRSPGTHARARQTHGCTTQCLADPSLAQPWQRGRLQRSATVLRQPLLSCFSVVAHRAGARVRGAALLHRLSAARSIASQSRVFSLSLKHSA